MLIMIMMFLFVDGNTFRAIPILQPSHIDTRWSPTQEGLKIASVISDPGLNPAGHVMAPRAIISLPIILRIHGIWVPVMTERQLGWHMSLMLLETIILGFGALGSSHSVHRMIVNLMPV
jgi:hypothetical protein